MILGYTLAIQKIALLLITTLSQTYTRASTYVVVMKIPLRATIYQVITAVFFLYGHVIILSQIILPHTIYMVFR